MAIWEMSRCLLPLRITLWTRSLIKTGLREKKIKRERRGSMRGVRVMEEAKGSGTEPEYQLPTPLPLQLREATGATAEGETTGQFGAEAGGGGVTPVSSG